MSKRRSRKLVDHEVQSSLVVRLCLHWALFMVATSIAMFLWVRLVEAPVASMAEMTSKLYSIFVPLLIVAIALLPVFVLDAVKLSNRFTGPIFRLRRTLAALAEGKSVRPLKFRSNDFWRSLADDFNRVVTLTPAPNAASPNKDTTNPS